MSGCKKKVSRWLLPLLLIATSTVGATSAELTRAVQLYYEGSPDEAINSIKSLALAGDVEAQLTLGNILFSLSKANKNIEIEDPVEWYKMAAVQGSADANSALGVIYHDKWIESRRNEDAAMAISYYEKAVELGNAKAQEYLNKLRRRGGFAIGVKLSPELTVTPEPTVSVEPEVTPEPTVPVEPEVTPEPTVSLEPETSPEPSIQTAQTSSADSSSQSEEANSTTPVKQNTDENFAVSSVQVGLTEIASQCSQYTAEGFNYYGESIVGSSLVGKAKIESIEPPSTQTNTQLIRLIRLQSSAVISLALHKVPQEIAAKLKEKSDFAFTGVVTNAQMTGSNCEISLMYQPAN